MMTRLFYHTHLNIAWMQANQAQQFLFVGICGCPQSTEGQGGLLINTLPKGRCNFCGSAIGMMPLLAYDQAKGRWLELFTNKVGQLETRAPAFETRTPSSGSESTPAIRSS